MGWIFLGLIALPLAAILYVLAQRFAPLLLELVPEALPGEAGTPATPGRGWRISPAQQRYARGAAAVVVLALVAVGVSRWPSAGP
ncbi:MAG TPA: hypothetical protein VK457_15050, partial [Chloroflexota bacterium]|nr:hypothetical protein [Chloroflexota bacterium]